MSDLSITFIIPVKNEQKNLDRCLSCIKEFEHKVVVDSGSTDRTCEVANAHGAQVINFNWNGRFPKKRNWTLRNYSFQTQWVMFLDADEYVTEALIRELRQVLPDTKHNGFWITFDNYFQDRLLKHGDKFRKLPLFKVGCGEYERIEEDHWSHLDMEVHEHPVIQGSIGELKSPIIHRDYKDLHDYIEKHNAYATWEARRYMKITAQGSSDPSALTDRQKKKYRMLRRWWFAPMYFIFSFVFKRGFLDGSAGLNFAILKMIYFYQIRLKIKEFERRI